MTQAGPQVEKKGVVRQLTEVATLLEVLGAEPFRANAYAAAARSLDAYDGDFAALFAGRRLHELRGVGKSLAAEMYALNGSPRLAVLDELYAQVPPGVRGLLRVSGLGPKKARQLWLNGVADPAELVAAAQDGRVAKLRGFGAKSAAVLGEAAAFALRGAARLRLDQAEAFAEAFEAVFMRALPEAALYWAGELRRKLETVGALEAVVVGAATAELSAALAEFGPEPHGSGAGVTSLFGGREVTLYPVSDDVLGAAIVFRTGDAAFVGALAARAEKRGLSLTGTGLSEGGRTLPTPAETDVFARLGLPYAPPERRDVPLTLSAEVPAADLVTFSDVRGLVHNHTSWSDGAVPLREMVAQARGLGYSYLALADHSKTSYYANGLSVERVFAQAKEVAAVREELRDEGSNFALLHGMEVDIMPDGGLDYPDEVLATLDYAVVSVHQHFTLAKTKQTERVVRAVHNPHAGILAHPTGRLLLQRPGYEIDLEAVLRACAETGTVVELNASPYRLDLDWRVARRALELGCRFSVDPDAHHPDGYDDVRYGVLMARKAGLRAADIVNTAPTAAAFLARLKPAPGRRGPY